MVRFNDCYGLIKDWILEVEGGYSNDPKDAGGETKFGISKRSYPNLDIKNLTIEKAMEIYRKNYWEPLNLDKYSLPVSLVIFDTAINMGRETALAIWKLVKYDPVKDEIKFIMNYLAVREKYYTRLTNFSYFGRGWINRVAKLKEKVLEILDRRKYN